MASGQWRFERLRRQFSWLCVMVFSFVRGSSGAGRHALLDTRHPGSRCSTAVGGFGGGPDVRDSLPHAGRTLARRLFGREILARFTSPLDGGLDRHHHRVQTRNLQTALDLRGRLVVEVAPKNVSRPSTSFPAKNVTRENRFDTSRHSCSSSATASVPSRRPTRRKPMFERTSPADRLHGLLEPAHLVAALEPARIDMPTWKRRS